MRAAMWIVLCGCAGEGVGDTGVPGPPTGTEPTASADWCQVQSTLRSRCTQCHRPGNVQGDLDLSTDAWSAIVGVESLAFGAVLVAPGDPDGSLLVRKMAGTQTEAEGLIMPPAGLLPTSMLEPVRQWIAAGATETCDPEP